MKRIKIRELDTSQKDEEFEGILKKVEKDIKRESGVSPDKVLSPDTLTVKDLAYDLKMTPTQLRRKLRRAGIDKPGGRWEWPADSEEVRKIRKF